MVLYEGGRAALKANFARQLYFCLQHFKGFADRFAGFHVENLALGAGGALHQGNIMVRFAKRQEGDLGFANVRRAAMIRHRTLPDYLFGCLAMLRKRIATPPVANFSRPAVRQGT